MKDTLRDEFDSIRVYDPITKVYDYQRIKPEPKIKKLKFVYAITIVTVQIGLMFWFEKGGYEDVDLNSDSDEDKLKKIGETIFGGLSLEDLSTFIYFILLEIINEISQRCISWLVKESNWQFQTD